MNIRDMIHRVAGSYIYSFNYLTSDFRNREKEIDAIFEEGLKSIAELKERVFEQGLSLDRIEFIEKELEGAFKDAVREHKEKI